jgi:general secretion pathway protein J
VIKTTRDTRFAGRGSEGFTLIELLVALALFSLLVTGLLGAMHYGISAWKRTTVQVDQLDHTLHVQNFLRRLIEDAYPLFIADGATRKYVDFKGNSISLDFLSSVPIALATGGRARFTLSVTAADGHVELVAASDLELTNRGGAPLTTRALISDLESVEISYFGRVRTDRTARWHESWTEQPTLPQLIRIRVRYPAGDPRIWPELLAAPRITADVGCVHDPLTNGCRGR